MPHREILESICEGCSGKYCTLKEIILNGGLSDRQLMQTKCVEKLKYERSILVGYDIGWESAHKLFIEDGYAAVFSQLYEDHPTLPMDEFYNRLMKRHVFC